MATERQPVDLRLTGIHINLIDRIVTLQAEDGRKANLSFGEPRPSPSAVEAPDEMADDNENAWEEMMPPSEVTSAPPADSRPAPEPRERQQTVTLIGSLVSLPEAGRLDRQGNPTVSSLFSTALDGTEDPTVYLATFHRSSAAIALGLKQGAQLKVEGYSHPSDPSRQLPNCLSVIAIHEYPGKAPSRRGRRAS
jgi:hypothetical protein